MAIVMLEQDIPLEKMLKDQAEIPTSTLKAPGLWRPASALAGAMLCKGPVLTTSTRQLDWHCF